MDLCREQLTKQDKSQTPLKKCTDYDLNLATRFNGTFHKSVGLQMGQHPLIFRSYSVPEINYTEEQMPVHALILDYLKAFHYNWYQGASKQPSLKYLV